MDVAKLRYEIDSSQAKTAEKNLGGMTKAAKSAENAQNGLSGTATKAARSIKAANDNIAQSSTAVARSIGLISKAMAPLGGIVVAAFSVKPLFAFKDALAEVSTLVDATTFSMRELEGAALAQAAAFGGGAAGQVKAYYQIISAGASSAAEATEILTAANKLAVGGVTDVTTAADGLTSVLNAYGDKVEGATAVSDALFVGMRAGKTTIGELASSLGKVAPLAAQTGVSFDELVASVSALTKGGIATTEAVTGVRAILAAVAKPAKEASDLAKSIGLEFNAAGLKSKGFASFMEEVIEKTGGSTDALSLLFGGVEALVPVMALAGQAGLDFGAILEQMDKKAGSTAEAFEKMANSPGFQAGRVWSSLQAEVLGLGSAMSGPLTAAMKAVADNMHAIVLIAGVFAAGHLANAVALLVTQFLALASGIGAATVAARGLSVAMAFVGGPIGLAVSALAAGFLLFRDRTDEATQAMQRLAGEAQSLSGVQSLIADTERAQGAYMSAISNTANAQSSATASIVADTKREFEAKRSLLELELKRQEALIGTQRLALRGRVEEARARSGADMLDYSGYSPYARNPVADVASRSLRRELDADADTLQQMRADLALTEIATGKLREALNVTFKDAQGGAGGAAQSIDGVGESATKAGKSIKDAADKGKDAWKGLRKVTDDTLAKIQEATNGLGQSLGGIFKGLLDKTLSWKDAAIQAFNTVLLYLNKMNLARGGSGIFGGGFLQSLIGGFLGISFAGGGYTGNGTRAGGIDGKGGFPAILHPQETVIDHTRPSYRPANGNERVGVQEVKLLVAGEEGPMFRPTIRAESQGVAVQVVQSAAPAIVQSSVKATQAAARNRPGFFR